MQFSQRPSPSSAIATWKSTITATTLLYNVATDGFFAGIGLRF